MSAQFVPRPRLTVRLGVTGTLAVAAAERDRLRREIDRLLVAVEVAMRQLVESGVADGVYDLSRPPRLRVISPLAPGADRLVAEVALARGAELDVVTPFALASYEKDFPESVDDFRTLLARAEGRVFELDGERHDEIDDLLRDDPSGTAARAERDRAYEAAGHMVVRNADLVVALWDRRPGGRGGTGDIVRYAAAYGPPVVRISSDRDEEPEWILDLADFHRAEPWTSSPAGRSFEGHVVGHLTAILTPPDTAATRHRTSGAVERAITCWSTATDPLQTFLTAAPAPRRTRWRLYDGVIRVFAGPAPRRDGEPAEPPHSSDPAWLHWKAVHEPVDELAIAFADRYRTASVAAFFSAALALMAAGVGLFHHDVRVTAVELVALATIFAAFFVNLRGGWHARFVDYRLLAELTRNQRALSLVGSSLPIEATGRVTGDAEAAPGRESWVGWYLRAMMRSAPLPTGSIEGTLPEVGRVVCEGLIEAQANYHERNEKRIGAAAEAMERASGILFFVTFAAAAAEFLLGWGAGHGEHGAHGVDLLGPALGVVTVVTSSLSAALFGILSFAELKVHAEQSARMAKYMSATARRLRDVLERIEHGRDGRRIGSLHSQELAAELHDVAAEMMQDIAGWSRLSRVKSLGLG